MPFVLQQLRRSPDVLLDAGHPEQFHRPDVVAASTWVDGSCGVPLDEGVPHPVAAREKRHGQAHQGATGDKDRNPVVGSFTHRLPPGEEVRV
jgi:hypothetical protein